MRKLINLMLAGSLALSLCACGSQAVSGSYSGIYQVKKTVYSSMRKEDGTFDDSIADTDQGYSSITYYNEKGLIEKYCVLAAYDGENGEALDESKCPENYEITEVGGVKCLMQIKDKYTYTYDKNGYPEEVLVSELGDDTCTETTITFTNTTKKGKVTAVSMDGYLDLSNSVIYDNCTITTTSGTITFTDGDLSSLDLTDGSYYHYDNYRNAVQIYSVGGGYTVDITYNDQHLMSLFDYKSNDTESTEDGETITNYTFTETDCPVEGYESWIADCGSSVLKIYDLDSEGRVVYTSYTGGEDSSVYGSTYTEYQ